MTATLTPTPKQQFFDANGNPLVGGKLYSYSAGTTSPVVTYVDSEGVTTNTNPIILDSRGEANVWLGTGTYKFKLVSATDVEIWTVDNIPGAPAANAALVALAASDGSSLVGFIQSGTGAVATTVQTKLRESVSVKDFGAGNEVGALLQAAINSGARSIEIPDASNWTWTTPVVIPELWRGRIFSKQSKSNPIIARTGHNYPMIDAQGALFVEIEGVVATANDSLNTAPACFIVFARMPSGASSSNHKMSGNLIEGAFFYCGIYNCGGEELNFENNYYSLYACANTIAYHTAPIVHTLNEDAYFSGIVTKAARTNAVSTSAIKHLGDVVKSYNVGGSCIYIGPNVNDVTFDLTYGGVIDNGYFMTLGGYYDNIMLGVDRVECNKSTPIVYAPVNNSAGSVSIYKGAYLRSGTADSNKYAIEISGSNTESCTLYVNPAVKWMSSSTGEEDIYLLRCLKKLQCDVSFVVGAQFETLSNTQVYLNTLVNSSIAMGYSANLNCGSYLYGNKLWFFSDPISSKATEVLYGGLKFGSTSSDVNALDYYKEGSYTASTFGLGSVTATITYTRVGNVVTLYIPNITGTSNDVLFNLLNLPAEITPSTGRYFTCNVMNNGTALSGSGVVNTDNVVYLFNNLTQTFSTWTNSGTKGVYGTSVAYLI